MKSLKNIILPLLALFVLFSSNSLFSQEKGKSELDKKIAELKGKVEKITVKVDGKDVVFEGKDAENLVKKMKSGGLSSFAYSIGSGKAKSKAYTIISGDMDDIKNVDAEDFVVSLSNNGDEGKETKNIKVKKVDGKLKLNLIETDKDGNKVEKNLEGEEAEKYLKENNDGAIFVTGKKLSAKMPDRVKIVKGHPARVVVIEKDSDGDDDEDIAEATVYISKSDKNTKNVKDVLIKKKKTEVKKEDKED